MTATATERPWVEGTIPTPDQLAHFLTVCTDEERRTIAERMLSASESASRCFLMNHEALQGEVDFLRRRVMEIREEVLAEFLAIVDKKEPA